MKFLSKLSLVTLTLTQFFIRAQAKSTQEYLSSAQQFISNGNLNQALSTYSEAITNDPNNYLIYIRRAILYLNVGKTENAIDDFSNILNINPDFDQAYIKRGKLYFQLAKFDLAKNDLEKYQQYHPEDQESNTMINEIDEAQELIKHAKKEIKSKNYEKSIEYLTKVIQYCPQNVEIRKLRAESYLSINQKEMAIGDFSRAIKLQPDNTDILVRIGELRMEIGELEEALNEVKECLHRDPEHKKCKSIFRQLKKLDRSLKYIDTAVEGKKWKDVIEKIDSGVGKEIEKMGADNLKFKIYYAACKASLRLKKADEAKQWCSKGLTIDSQNIDLLINRAEASMILEDYDAALRDYSTAHEYNPQDHRIIEGYNKAQRLMKMASRKDYYKTLGVKKTATKREIKKAYRQLAQIYHPDKYQGDMSKEQVEAKMSELNEAYEVLSNEETRERYDNGEDPNDPTGGQGQGNPFQGFPGGFPFGNGGPFGGSNGGFQFHFNF